MTEAKWYVYELSAGKWFLHRICTHESTAMFHAKSLGELRAKIIYKGVQIWPRLKPHHFGHYRGERNG